MSVVIAIKDDDKVYMAADTMVTYGDSKRHLTTESSQKIWAVGDTANCIMGGAGYLRDINLIRYCTTELVPEANLIKEDITVGTIMIQTVPLIFETIRNYTKIIEGEQSTTPIGSSFFWAYKGHLFLIMTDGVVEEVEDYEAIGSGADAALASLKHTAGESVYDRLYKALEAASDISLYVSNPYVVIDTDSCTLAELVSDEEMEDAEANEDAVATKDDTKIEKTE